MTFSDHFSYFCHQHATLAPLSPNREMASACLVQPIAVPAREHPVFAPVEMVTTAQTQILQTLCAPVSQDCFQLPALFFYVCAFTAIIKHGFI